MAQTKNKKKFTSTKSSMPLAEIRNDCLVMKDGSLRAVLMVSSINFALKSADEQQAIINAYMQFLNSFDYQLQIVLQSRRLNIDKYIEKLKQAEKEQANELLRLQIADYRNYVSELVKIGDIMSKKFYVIVPYNPLSDKKKNFFTKAGETFSPGTFIHLSEEKFKERRKELFQRAGHISSNLNSIGLSAAPLDTQQLIELFYNFYNPDLADKEKLTDVSKIRLED